MTEAAEDISEKERNQKNVFEFFKRKYRAGETFTLDELASETTWQRSTFPTYWSKQFKDFAVKLDNGKYRVSRSFRTFMRWEKFRDHVTQNRRVATSYEVDSFNSVIIFEFFMPLTHEGVLRALLDELFYKDSLFNLLKSVDAKQLKNKFPPKEGEQDEQYYARACEWLSKRFGGYSISHVNGRFRSGKLKTTGEAAKAFSDGKRYIIDETTAIVRFIFPCGESESRQLSTMEGAEEEPAESSSDGSDCAEEAAQVRWFFEQLFVQSILEAVSGEDEVWVVESGMSNGLHIFKGVDKEKEA